MIAHAITSGHIASLILALTFLELIALIAYRRITQRGPTLANILPNLLAGDFLLLAWRLSAHWPYAAAALLAALLAHGTDLVRRWG
jgi:hypothetical protein